MNYWTVSPGGSSLAVGVESASHLISAIGAKDRTLLASAMLSAVRTRVFAHHCALLAFEGERSPRLISGSSLDQEWQLFNAASVYAKNFYRLDGLQRLIRCYPASFESPPVIVQRQRAADIEDTEYRAQCYDKLGIVDRVTVLVRVGQSQSLAVNWYRDSSAGLFSDDDIAFIIGLAPLIACCITRHYGLDMDGESNFRGVATDELSKLSPDLTLREREVVQRILDGVTTERIADDLHIRPTTVITYRTRAYDKIGVTSRRELFAAVLGRQNTGRALAA